MNEKRFRRVVLWVLYAVVAYVVTASTCHRFRNPKMTETELFLHLGEAMLWR